MRINTAYIKLLNNQISYQYLAKILMKPENISQIQVVLKDFTSQAQLDWIVTSCRAQLSEPYSLYTYNYFLTNWPELTIMAYHQSKIIGFIIGNIDTVNPKKAYIGMLVVSPQYRRAKIGKKLFDKFYQKVQQKVDKIVLQTQCVNIPATKFYLKLGFFKTRCMKNYYMSGTDAFRLKLYIRQGVKKENQSQSKQQSQQNQSPKKEKACQKQRSSKLSKKLDEKQKQKMAQGFMQEKETAQQEQANE